MPRAVLIDTNIAIFYFKGHPEVVRHLTAIAPSEVRIAAISWYELLVGAERSRQPQVRRQHLATLARHVRVLDFTPREAEHAATVQATLAAQGAVIGPLDTLIAATALSHNLVLATNNLGEFTRVPGLICEDWTSAP